MTISLYFHTLRYLKVSQIYWRLYYKLFAKSAINLVPAPALRNYFGNWIKPIAKDIKMLGSRQFKFLNEIHDILEPNDWGNPVLSKLWLYNLHYFDDLNCKFAEVRKYWHQNLINEWIHNNPPDAGNGWEPYPISLRIVNWIKWNLAGNVLDDFVKHSLAVQARYLMRRLEYHLLGNHLFANAKALIYAGLFFVGSEADTWFNKGVQILEDQLPEQVLPDGGNFELSPMYHAIFLEDVLDIINIYNCYNVNIPEQINSIAKSMFTWLLAMTHPNGELSFFNDTANGISAATEDLQLYYQNLGFKVIVPAKTVSLTNSGYVRIEKGGLTAIVDIAAVGPDYIPGHAHADSLSFECSLFGQKVIVNSGISLYGSSQERLKQRGSKAHSTLVIDDKDSSEVWDGFRVARRARILNPKFEQREDGIIVSASHDGYCRLQGRPIHHREWRFAENCLEIMDTVQGKGKHKIEINYYLHPDIVVINSDTKFVKLLINGHKAMMIFEGAGKLYIEPSIYHPEFGLDVKNKKIAWLNIDSQLTFKCKMSLYYKD